MPWWYDAPRTMACSTGFSNWLSSISVRLGFIFGSGLILVNITIGEYLVFQSALSRIISTIQVNVFFAEKSTVPI